MQKSTLSPMRFGNDEQHLYLSSKDVRNALDAMVSGSANQDHTVLRSLLIVHHVIENPDVPSIDPQLAYPVYRVLIDVISSEITRYRKVLDVAVVEGTTKADYLEQIANDMGVQSQDLVGWSILYHCYVRVDINLSVEQFAKVAGIGVRSARRYRNQAVESLTHVLIEQETAARQNHKKRLLYASLPGNTRRLIGRTTEQNQLYDCICKQTPSHVLLSGAPGIGKSTLTEATLSHAIANGDLFAERIVWINNPQSLQDVIRKLSIQLLPYDSTVDVSEWLQAYQCLIVLDNISAFGQHLRSGLVDLLKKLSASTVICIVDEITPGDVFDHRIMLTEIPKLKAHELIRVCAQSAHQEISPWEVEQIYQRTSGNPLAICTYVTLWFEGEEKLDHNTLMELVGRHLGQLGHTTKQLWIALNLFGEGGCTLSELRHIWPSLNVNEHLSHLSRRFLAMPQRYRFGENDQHVCIPDLGRQYFRLLYERDSTTRDIVNTFLVEVTDALLHTPDIALRVVESVMFLEFVDIPHTVQADWIDICGNLKAPVDDMWKNAVGEAFDMHDQNFSESLGSAQHYLDTRQLTRAKYIAEQLVAHAGEAGDFVVQSQALMILAQIAQSQGYFVDAYNLLIRCKKDAQRRGDEAFLSKCIMEITQIELERREGRAALNLLNQLPDAQKTSFDYQFKVTNALILIDRLSEKEQDHLIEILDQVFVHALENQQRHHLGRVHHLAGQWHIKDGNYEEALKHLHTAVSYFDIEDDPVAFARCMTNLAVAHMKLDAHDHALALLDRALKVQMAIGDQLGLALTRYNQVISNQKLS